MNKKSLKWILSILGRFMCLFCVVSCEKENITRSLDKDDTKFINESSGISLIIDNDSLEDEIEEIHFYAEEWHEEEMNEDL